MARIYATAADYTAFTGQDPAPSNVDALLAQASRFLDANVFRLCWFAAADDTGMPTDASVIQAFTDATCAQAQWWDALGDSIGTVGVGWSSVSIGSVTLSRGTKATPDTPADQAARQIAPAVWDVLASPDLTPFVFRLGLVVTL